MATISGTTQVKFVKVLELADFNDIKPVDGTIYFIEDAKKIYLDGKMYGFNDEDVDGKFLPITGGRMQGNIDTTANTLYVAHMENVERLSGTIKGEEERDFIEIDDFGVRMQLHGEDGDLLSHIQFHPDGIKLSGDSHMSIKGLSVVEHGDTDFENLHSDTALSAGTLQSFKGAAGGFAELDTTGKVPAGQLPSYVDDILEVNNYGSLPKTGDKGKLYVTVDNNKLYRWGGSAWINVSDGNAHLVIGTTVDTAYNGKDGLTAYTHSQITGESDNPHNINKNNVGLGHVKNYLPATKDQAEAGTLSTAYMTPIRTKEAIEKLAPKLTWTVVE